MKAIALVSSLCLLAACEPVDFAKRNELSLVERAAAVDTLRLNAAALNAGDLDALERTIDENSPLFEDAVHSAQATIARYGPTVGIRDVRLVSEKRGELVLGYVQTIAVARGHLPFSAAQVETTLVRGRKGWAISSTRVLSLKP